MGFFGTNSSVESIFNETSDFGDRNSDLSIYSTTGPYGANNSEYSTQNTSAEYPPYIVKNGIPIGYVTTNQLFWTKNGYPLSSIEQCQGFISKTPSFDLTKVELKYKTNQTNISLFWDDVMFASTYVLHQCTDINCSEIYYLAELTNNEFFVDSLEPSTNYDFAIQPKNNYITGKPNIVELKTKADEIPPNILLNGPSEVIQLIGTPYYDLGATASDDIDDKVSITINGEVNIYTEGVYTLTFIATDKAGNTSTLDRRVIVGQDSDNDGILDNDDFYPLIPIGKLLDTDNDGAPDACGPYCMDLGMQHDTDADNDGILNAKDAYPFISIQDFADVDSDGAPDICSQSCLQLGMDIDSDSSMPYAITKDYDNDGIPDYRDKAPFKALQVIQHSVVDRSQINRWF